MIAVIGLWIGIGLLAIAVLALIISGIRGMINGHIKTSKVGMMLLPIAIWVVILLITGSWVTAGLATALIMIVLMILVIFVTGVMGVFT